MKRQTVRKLLTSIPGLTILYGLPFGLLMFFIQGPSHTSPFGSYVSGVVFGVAMAFVTRKKNIKNLNEADALRLKKSETLDSYLKKGIVPNTKAETARLEEYMSFVESHQQKIQTRYYPKKYSKLYTYLLLTSFFLLTLFALDNLRWLAIIYPLVIAIGLYGELKQKALKKQISDMRHKLSHQKDDKRRH